MIAGSRNHRRYLAGLASDARANLDYCRALDALTDDDRAWLAERGWKPPAYAAFVSLNRLPLDDLAAWPV